MVKKIKRKEKKKYEKEKIGKYHVWALVDMISEEWKEVKDKTIKELERQIEVLKKDLETQRSMYNSQTKAYNNQVHISNILGLEKDLLITQLQNQIQKLKTGSD